jgi:hypothetical protein
MTIPLNTSLDNASILRIDDCQSEGDVRFGRRAAHGEQDDLQEWDGQRTGHAPRWAVVMGVVAYCVVAWAAVFHFGGAAADWMVARFQGTPTEAATEVAESHH